jgi:Fe-S cluster assembly iron-binding protein IscA
VKTAKIRNSIKEGEQKLRITVTGAGCNIDNIKFTCTTPSGITELTDDDDTDTGVSYNLAGQKVGTGYKGIVIRNGRKVFVK